MWTPILILGLAANNSDSTFPDWRKSPDSGASAVGAKRGNKTSRRKTNESSWIVVSEHPAIDRDSLGSVEVTNHPLLTALMWPIDHAVRPVTGLVFEPMRAPIRYGEQTELIDRGQSFMHPTGRESLLLYPTAVLDGSTGSRWGVTLVDKDFAGEGWRLQVGGAVTVAADCYIRAWTQSPEFGPFSQKVRWGGSYTLNREVGLHVPDLYPVWDTRLAGATSERHTFAEMVVSNPGPIAGSGWDLGYQYSRRKVGKPRRVDADFRDYTSLDWFEGGDRGVRGVEIDHNFSLAGSWSDQENPGAPTKGGTIKTKVWYTLADGGGDVAGFNVQASRYFLLGTERYVYKKEDLQPYLDMDPIKIIKMLDPSTLRQRLSQRKILALYFRASRIWELDPAVPASYFLYQGMGGDAPARAYSGRYLMGKALIGGTVEYRWPIWRYIDGTSFAELAWAAPDWWEPNLERIAPGIGGGLRVRLPRMFLFRIQAAFGLAGSQLIMTTDAEF